GLTDFCGMKGTRRGSSCVGHKCPTPTTNRATHRSYHKSRCPLSQSHHHATPRGSATPVPLGSKILD
ncbi:MAG: hypothetical protein FWC71_11525, partial [Defluviitaleaceae bacterium]|nr:hypothetical protein [Defluviitaleaceae bacterium]